MMEEQEAKIQVVHTVVSAEWQNAHTHLPWAHGRTESPSKLQPPTHRYTHTFPTALELSIDEGLVYQNAAWRLLELQALG